MSTGVLTLYTFVMSHYSEKIRWTLDAAGLPYEEVVMTPFLHLIPALLMGGQGETTLPILKVREPGGEVVHIQDSTRILQWLDKHRGPLALMPRDRPVQEDIMEIEARFDAIGRDVARFLYLNALQHDKEILALWCRHARPGQARLLRWLFPLIKWGLKRRLRITPAAAAQSELRIQQALAWLDGRISDGRHHLVGKQLSVADITAASILAPMVCPVEHPIYGEADFRERIGQPPRWLVDRPCVAWVRRIYETDRHRSPTTALQGAANSQQAAA